MRKTIALLAVVGALLAIAPATAGGARCITLDRYAPQTTCFH